MDCFSTGTLRCWYLLYSYAMVLCVLHNLKDKVFECHIPGCALTTLGGILQNKIKVNWTSSTPGYVL